MCCKDVVISLYLVARQTSWTRYHIIIAIEKKRTSSSSQTLRPDLTLVSARRRQRFRESYSTTLNTSSWPYFLLPFLPSSLLFILCSLSQRIHSLSPTSFTSIFFLVSAAPHGHHFSLSSRSIFFLAKTNFTPIKEGNMYVRNVRSVRFSTKGNNHHRGMTIVVAVVAVFIPAAAAIGRPVSQSVSHCTAHLRITDCSIPTFLLFFSCY